MNKLEMIHMSCYLSDTYINYAGASWVSLFENTDASITLHVSCVSESYHVKNRILSKENREKLEKMVHSYGHQIIFYEIDKLVSPEIVEAVQEYESMEKAGRFAGGGVAAYAYVLILKFLPEEVKRFINFGTDCMFNLDTGNYGKHLLVISA